MDFNKIKEMGLEYAEKGKNAALDLAEKGRTPAKIVNAQSNAAAEPAEEKPEDNEAKTCPQCGAPVSDDALFCNKCGAQL